MTQRHEIIDLLQEELQKYGLRGEVSDRSKHLELSWQTPHGSRFVIVARTASDWRAGMNSRRDLRRLLRADNMQPKQERVTSFQHAMSLPREPVVSVATRERALQQDVEALSDIVLELQEQNVALLEKLEELTGKLENARVVSTVTSVLTFDEQPASQPVVEIKQAPKREYVTSNEIVLSLLSYEWQPVSTVKERSGLNAGVVNQCLMRLRKRGLIENGLRGQWRKKPNGSNGHTFLGS